MEAISIINFSKGMNNYVEPGRLGSDTARLVSDARVTTGALVPIKKPTEAVEQSTPEDLDHHGWIDRSVVKWLDNYYWSLNDTVEAPFYGGNEYPIGIEPPTVKFTVDNSGQAFKAMDGNYKYCITQTNSDEWESAPQAYSDSIRYKPILLNEELASIYITAPTEDWVENINLYRTVNGGANFYLVKSFQEGEYGKSYLDSLKDEFLLFNASLQTYAQDLPPDGGKYLTERDGYFYLAVGDKLYVSKNGNPHYWNLINWLGFEDTITGISTEYQGLLVMTANKTWRVGGGDVTNAYKQEVKVDQGCANWRTIASMGNTPVWVSNDGVCIWDGQNIIVPTLNKFDFDTAETKFAFSANDRYHLFMNDGRCLVFDIRSGNIFYERKLDYGYGWYDAETDITYFCDVDPYKLYIDETGTNETFEYLSALVPGDELALRDFFRCLIDADGEVLITVYDEKDNQVADLYADCDGRTEVLFPSGLTIRGMSVRLQSDKNLRSLIIYYEDIGI
jgi:hypothetical protein